jgi:hypothetical protein
LYCSLETTRTEYLANSFRLGCLRILHGGVDIWRCEALILTLVRDLLTDSCTMGRMAAALASWDTIERPWVPRDDGGAGGMAGVSCVPTGTYDLILHSSAAHPKTWALQNFDLGVSALPYPNMRSECLIHSGNLAAQSEGCILLGMKRTRIDWTWEVLESRDAFIQLMGLVPWTNGHKLVISQ